MQEHLLRRSSPALNARQSRNASQTPGLFQRQAQKRQLDSHTKKLDYAVSPSEYKQGFRYRQRRINLYTKDSLGMDSLGRPAEALILRSHNKEKFPGSVNGIPKLDNFEEVQKSASEMLQEIDAERGIVGTQRVAENLEDVRSTWVSKLQRKDKPTEAELKTLAKTLEDGFTHKQLGDYYGPEDLELTDDADDLNASFSTNLYTRTPWIHGTTPFPRHPFHRFTAIKEAFKARGAKAELADPKPVYPKTVHKSTIIDKILRQRWRISTEDDETAVGEIDVWPHREHFRVLQNHNQGLLYGLSKRYGVKIDASDISGWGGVIRITGDRDTSFDVLKFIVYMLERMRRREVVLPQESETINRNAKITSRKERLRDTVFRGQLQQITNTIIDIVPGSAVSSGFEKVVIHFLGPAEDDFEDAKRLLLQSLQLSLPREVMVKYGASTRNRAIAPVPVVVRKALPLAERNQEWSRWTRTVERNNNDAGSELKARDSDDSEALGVALKATEKLHRHAGHSSAKCHLWMPKSAHWLPDLELSQSVVMGRVIYPEKSVKDLDVVGQGKKREDFPTAFWRTINSCREFLTSSNGLRHLRPSYNSAPSSKVSKKEYLEIKMSPKQGGKPIVNTPTGENDPQYDQQGELPDLEIRLDIDQENRTLIPSQTRVVFMNFESDILLPHRSTDVRFLTQQYTSASANLYPEILAFIEASDLDIWGSDRLKTPSSLALCVPIYTAKGTRDTGSGENQPERQKPTEYILTGLEHRTQLLAELEGFQYEYTVIEAGRVGGRREEFRVRAPNQIKSTKKYKGPISALFDKASQWLVCMESTRKNQNLDGLRNRLTNYSESTDRLRRRRTVVGTEVRRWPWRDLEERRLVPPFHLSQDEDT